MKTLAHFFISLVVAGWIVVIAILSVQNATPVNLRFLTFRSIELPVGLVLAFSAALGITGMALTQPLWNPASQKRGNSRSNNDDEDFSFFEE